MGVFSVQQGIDAGTPNIFLKYIIPLLKTVLINIIVSWGNNINYILIYIKLPFYCIFIK